MQTHTHTHIHTQVGAKFDGVQLFCARDAVENAAEGEFRFVCVCLCVRAHV